MLVNTCSWIPLGVLLGKPFLGISPDLQLLPFPQLDNQDVIILPIVVGLLLPAPGGHWNHLRQK